MIVNPAAMNTSQIAMRISRISRSIMAAVSPRVPATDIPPGIAVAIAQTLPSVQMAIGVYTSPGSDAARYSGMIYAANHFH